MARCLLFPEAMIVVSASAKARPPRRARWARVRLIGAMVLVVAVVGALAWWDGKRESASALEDFAQEQATLATSVAADLGTRLALARQGDRLPVSPQQLLAGLARVVRPGESELLVLPPGSTAFVTASGRPVQAPRLLQALAGEQRTVRIERAEAVELGLPQRTAIAGIATVDAGTLGRWGIAVVATALRERDRERRAGLRLILAIAFATGLVGAFGGQAMRNQRHELRLEQDLALAELARQRDERLDRLDKAATMLTMASGMAHELGTPLGVIVGRAEQLLRRAAGDERDTRAAQAILDQAEHINEVVRGFLDLARGGPPSLQLVPPAMVVSSALALVEHRFARAGVQLASNVPDDLPAVGCEPRLIQHALVNLLLNACDACPPGSRVELTAELAEGGLRFVVLDDGAGITSADAARVTEPFFTTKAHGKGTGLGLAIVSEIAKSHRGSLSLTPALPRGTRACVQLPLPAEVPFG